MKADRAQAAGNWSRAMRDDGAADGPRKVSRGLRRPGLAVDP